MKKFALALILVLNAQAANALCMKNIGAVKQNEKKDNSCKASFVNSLLSNFGNKSLRGTGMASGYRITFTEMNDQFTILYNGSKIKGALCCEDGRWQMQNSEGTQTLSSNKSGVMISGYMFTPEGSAGSSRNRTAAGYR